MKILKTSAVVILMILTATACKQKRHKADISDMELGVQFTRMDTRLFNIPLDELEDSVLQIVENHNHFMELYSMHIIGIGSPYEKEYLANLQSFITDYTMNQVYKETIHKIPETKNIEKDIENALKRYHFFFPEKPIPNVYFFNGGFNQSLLLANDVLAIGTDRYLGADCKFYPRLGIPKYQSQNMYPEKIPGDAIKAWISTEYVYNDSIDNLSNHLVYHGKIQYCLDYLLPSKHDSIKFNYTAREVEWCRANEAIMWEFLIDRDLLFSRDYMTINKMVNIAPYTSGFPQDSPGQAVLWIGREIVRSYMKHHPGTTLKELMENDDYSTIFSESRYEP